MLAALAYSSQKEIYNRKTISALNHEILQMPFISFYATQIINPFLIEGSQPIMIKCRDFQPMVKNPYKGVVSLL